MAQNRSLLLSQKPFDCFSEDNLDLRIKGLRHLHRASVDGETKADSLLHDEIYFVLEDEKKDQYEEGSELSQLDYEAAIMKLYLQKLESAIENPKEGFKRAYTFIHKPELKLARETVKRDLQNAGTQDDKKRVIATALQNPHIIGGKTQRFANILREIEAYLCESDKYPKLSIKKLTAINAMSMIPRQC